LQAIKDIKAMPPIKRHIALGLLFLSLGLVAVAQHDIQSRAQSQVRGPKLFWRVICLNALGAVGYFRWGRRAGPAPPPSS
jgi:hypothetical protein